jgi:hypothetical protein
MKAEAQQASLLGAQRLLGEMRGGGGGSGGGGSGGGGSGGAGGGGGGGGGKTDSSGAAQAQDKTALRNAEAARRRAGDRTRSLVAVKRYWKIEVERDPMSILSLIDIPLKSFREYAESVVPSNPREDQTLLREVITARIDTGKWRTWRANSCACHGVGRHLTSHDQFQCLERRFPRDVKREEAGDASVW